MTFLSPKNQTEFDYNSCGAVANSLVNLIKDHRSLLRDFEMEHFFEINCDVKTKRPILINCRVSQKVVPCLCACCGGDVDSIISVFTQLHRSSFSLEFQTLYESILQKVTD